MAGTLTATTIQNDTSSPPTFRNNSVEIGRLCRAWLNYNSNAQTITGSFNISSVVRNSAGNFTVNFTNNMPDTNYCVVVGPTQSTSNNNGGVISVFLSATNTYSAPLVGSFRFVNYHAANTAVGDSDYNCLAVFR